MADLSKKPYETILNWADKRMKFTGRTVFSYLALMPPSLILPDIKYLDLSIRTNIHVLFLAPSGSAKSSISDVFSKITINPFKMKSITSASMEDQLQLRDNTTMIIDDMATISRDKILTKTVEGILEEKRVERFTAQKTRNFAINACLFAGGVPQDLTGHLSSGFIFRVAPIIVMHEREQQQIIGSHIADMIGKDFQNDVVVEDIKDYYAGLHNIQLGKNKEIPRITGYRFTEEQRDVLLASWSNLLDKMDTDKYSNWYRELQSGFRYLVSSAFLNVYNRKLDIKNGQCLLEPNKEDLRIATYLMQNELMLKKQIITSDKFAQRIKSIAHLEKAVQELDVSQFTLDLIECMVKK